MILLGALILYVLMLTMLEQLSFCCVAAATATAAPPSHSKLIKFESLYTSNRIVLSAKTNWIVPVGAYKDHCYLCNYFGHGFNICSNIRPEFLGRCCKY